MAAQRGGGSPKPTTPHGAQAPKSTTHATSPHGGSATHGHSTAKAGASTHGGGHSTTKSTTSGSSVKTTKTTKKTATTTTTSAPTTTTTATPTTTPTTTTTLSPVQRKLQQNTNLASKLQSRLPAGTNLTVASSGFRNLGQFVAAVNVSNNLGIPFAQLKTRMVDQGMSLGQAIQDARPKTTDTTVVVRRAETDADVLIRTTEQTTTTTATTAKSKHKKATKSARGEK
jgi:hypothetical protein